MEATTFTCSICGEASRRICVFCTKDACPNHLCERCNRCSDCCECDVPLTVSDRREPIITTEVEMELVPNGTGTV